MNPQAAVYMNQNGAGSSAPQGYYDMQSQYYGSYHQQATAAAAPAQSQGMMDYGAGHGVSRKYSQQGSPQQHSYSMQGQQQYSSPGQYGYPAQYSSGAQAGGSTMGYQQAWPVMSSSRCETEDSSGISDTDSNTSAASAKSDSSIDIVPRISSAADGYNAHKTPSGRVVETEGGQMVEFWEGVHVPRGAKITDLVR